MPILEDGQSYPGEPLFDSGDVPLYMIGRPDPTMRFPIFDSYYESPMDLETTYVAMDELRYENILQLPQHRYRIYEVTIKEVVKP